MTLRETVEKYRALAGGFGRPVALSSFGLTPDEVTQHFGLFDEDYHISRFFRFTLATAVSKTKDQTYLINGFPQSHVSIDAEIETIL
jgi:hypothetical protein